MEPADSKTAIELANDILRRVEAYTGRDDREAVVQITQNIEHILSLKPGADLVADETLRWARILFGPRVAHEDHGDTKHVREWAHREAAHLVMRLQVLAA